MIRFHDPKGIIFQLFATFIANLMGIAEGMAMSWTAPMIPYFLSESSHIHMTESQAEWLETTFIIGSILGIPITALMVHKIGPKKCLLIAVVLVAVSWSVIALTKVLWHIYASRVVMGAALNIAYIAAPMYVSEIADKNIRGFLSSNVYLMSLIGQVLMYSIGPFVPFVVPSIIAVALLLVELTVFVFLPESPYFLASKNRPEEAGKSLQKFRGSVDVTDELKELVEGIEADRKDKFRWKELVTVTNYRKALIIMTVLMLCQPFSGFEVLLMNLHEILNSSGSEYLSAATAAVIFSGINLVAATIGSGVMDKFGRKMLLVSSSFLSGVCITLLAVYFNLRYLGYDLSAVTWAPMYSVFLFAAFTKFGLGLVPVVMTAELFAARVKGVCMTYADGMYMVGVFSAVQLFFVSKATVGVHFAFYFYGLCSFATFIFIIWYVPETRGKTMEEIQTVLRGKGVAGVAQ